MEDIGILNPTNNDDLFALHFVYLEKINSNLDLWREAWIRHRLRTSGSSPLKLFLSGNITCPVPELVEGDLTYYGVEGNIVQENETSDERPLYTPLDFNVNDTCTRDLSQFLNWTSNKHGIDIYLQVLNLLIEKGYQN